MRIKEIEEAMRTHKKLGNLVILEEVEPEVYGKKDYWIVRRFLCQCDCGNKTVISASSIGRQRTCGCSKKKIDTANPYVREVFSRTDLTLAEMASKLGIAKQYLSTIRSKKGYPRISRKNSIKTKENLTNVLNNS